MSRFGINKKLQEVFSIKTASSVTVGFALSGLIFGVGTLSTKPANAAAIAGLNFDDSAFADTLISSFGNYATSGGNLANVLTDTTEGTYAFSYTPGAFVELGFTDNIVFNGLGNDLALFELGFPDTFVVTLNGITRSYLSTYTELSAGGFNLNVATLNLDDFGIAANSSLNNILIGLDTHTSFGTATSLSLVGALNSRPLVVDFIPEPSTMLGLFTIGGFGLAFRRKKNKSIGRI